MELKLNPKQLTPVLFAVALILIFFYFILGFSGMMTALGIMLLFMLPTYLILNNFELDQDEKIIFSFFIGIGIFPAITYWLGMLISFRAAIFVTFIMLIAASLMIKKLKNK